MLPIVAMALGGTLEASSDERLWKVAVDPAGGGEATLSPSGDRFVVSSRRAGQWDLWQYAIDAGVWTRLTDEAGDDFDAQWSPDGTQLVFASTRSGQKDIWVLDLESGDLRRLSDSEHDDEYPAFSPSGEHVVYTGGPWEGRDFRVVAAAGGEPRNVNLRPLPMGGACSYEPGREAIVCHVYDQGSGDLVRVQLESGSMTSLTHGAAWDYKPKPSPDGDWIAFSRSVEGPADIWLLPLPVGRARPLVQSPHEDRWPTWSADGDRLLFHRIVAQGRAIKLLDRSTGDVRNLVEAEELALQASLHPDGRQLAYCVGTEEGREIRVRDLETGATRRLEIPGEACFPRWSPDGETIALVSKPRDRWEVAVMGADGGLELLTEEIEGVRGMDGPVDWSPDGKLLVFHADTAPFAADLFTVEVATGRLEKLTHDSWFDEAPSWSRDGQTILFMSTRGGDWTWGLFRLSLSDGEIQLVAGPDYVEKNFPREGPDGSLVWITVDESGRQQLVETARNGEARTLSAAGTEVSWPSYARGGSGLLFSVVERYVEYWIVEDPLGGEFSASANGKKPVLGQQANRSSDDRSQSIGQSPVDLHRR